MSRRGGELCARWEFLQPFAMPFPEIGGAFVVHFNRKTPLEVSPTGFSRDSNRVFTIKAFAILIKVITFVYQIVTVVNSRWIATELK